MMGFILPSRGVTNLISLQLPASFTSPASGVSPFVFASLTHPGKFQEMLQRMIISFLFLANWIVDVNLYKECSKYDEENTLSWNEVGTYKKNTCYCGEHVML